MDTTAALGASSIQPGVPDTGTLAAQNLFEHMAHTSGASTQAVTPAELGANIIDKLEGTIGRMQNFSQVSGEGQSAEPVIADGPDGGNAAEGLGDAHFDRMIESFSAMFDHAVEARLLASGASQTSGACTTLLRGQ